MAAIRIKLYGPSEAASLLLDELRAVGMPAEVVGVVRDDEPDERWHVLWISDPTANMIDRKLWHCTEPVVADFNRRHRGLRITLRDEI